MKNKAMNLYPVKVKRWSKKQWHDANSQDEKYQVLVDKNQITKLATETFQNRN